MTSDLYTFGLLAVALLTWRMPAQDHLLERGEIEALMEPLGEVVPTPSTRIGLKTCCGA